MDHAPPGARRPRGGRLNADATLLLGDAYDVLRTLPDRSVQCVVTSPPYWGLRDYGVPPRVWGGDPEHAHEFAEVVDRSRAKKGNAGSTLEDAGTRASEAAARRLARTSRFEVRHGFCECGAWRGVLGLEPDYLMYVEHLADLFDELKRILRPDGVAWLVIGDCYATGAGVVGDQGASWAGYNGRGKRGQALANQSNDGKLPGYRGDHPTSHGNGRELNSSDGAVRRGIGPQTQPNRLPQPGLKPKDLAMIPARVALALQERGWWIRSRVVWDKPNPMPESVRDRPTVSHEDVYLLTRGERYFWDWYAVQEPLESLPSDLRKMVEQGARYGSKHQNVVDPLMKASALTNIGRKRGVGDAAAARALLEAPADPSQQALAGFEGAGPILRARASGNEARDIPDEQDGRGIENDHLGRGIPWNGGATGGRNCRSVWRIATTPYPGAHFATFPPELVERCIKAGSSARACGTCGAPWERIVETETVPHPDRLNRAEVAKQFDQAANGYEDRGGTLGSAQLATSSGWRPGCECHGRFERRETPGDPPEYVRVYVPAIPLEEHPTVPCTVLDPFGGSGTTAAVAVGLGRRAIYVDANLEYLEQARHRVGPLLIAEGP